MGENEEEGGGAKGFDVFGISGPQTCTPSDNP
jgi:hypothetical protein